MPGASSVGAVDCGRRSAGFPKRSVIAGRAWITGRWRFGRRQCGEKSREPCPLLRGEALRFSRNEPCAQTGHAGAWPAVTDYWQLPVGLRQ